ncbi:MAG: YggT family protein, partial [Candidatus Limnocylindrus sp.]
MGFTPQLAADLVLQTLWFVVLARVLASWIDRSGSGRVSRILFDMSEPILGPV